MRGFYVLDRRPLQPAARFGSLQKCTRPFGIDAIPSSRSPLIAVAILLPWLALLLGGRMFQAALCLILQLTVLGWVPAALWAVVVVNDDKRERQYREMLRILHGR